MIASPSLLVGPATKAGMRVPPNPDEFDAEEYPHFAAFCAIQLGAPLPSATSHWDNAQVIAGVSDDEVRTITYEQLTEKGLDVA